MTVEEFFISLGFKTDKSSVSKAQSEAEALKGTLTKVLGAIGIGFSISGIKNFVQETASLAADLKATNTQFKQTFGDMADAAEESLKKVSENTGVAETRMKLAYSRMASFAMTGGMEVSEANDFTARAMEAIADNAAYMDKSIEYTQDIFQRLLKGNFQLDDNLNFNLAEAERNQMAMAMFQKKTYNDLTENEKKELILQKLISANKQMGAEGQASREAGEYTNQVGELSDVIKQLRAQVGAIFLPQVLTVSTKLATILTKIGDKLGDAEEEGTLAYKMTQKLTKAVDKFFDVCSKVYGIGKQVITMLGGFENAVNILSVAIGSVMAVLAVDKFASFIKQFDAANLKIWAVVAAIAALVLIIDDLRGFMNGKQSLFGDIIDSMGGDQNAVREGFKNFGKTISGWGESLVEFKDMVVEATDKVAQLFGAENAGDGLKQAFQALIEAANTYLSILEQIAGFLAYITGIDNVFSDEENVATSAGTRRMSKEDASEYRQAQHDMKGASSSQQRVLGLKMQRLEEKYEGKDTTTPGQQLIAKGNNDLMNTLDRVFNGGKNQQNASFSDMMHDTFLTFAQPLKDITFGLVDLEKIANSLQDDSGDTKDAVSDNAADAGSAVKAYTTEGENVLSQWSALAEKGSSSFDNLNNLNLNDFVSRNGGNTITQNNTITTNFTGATDANTKKAAATITATKNDGISDAIAFGR